MNKTIIFAASVLLLCGCTEGPLEKNGAQTVPVNGVTLDKEDVRLFLDHEITLNATVSPADATNKALLWDSSDKSVVTVADGLVKAIGLGTAIVTVTTEDGEFNDTCTIKVTEECQTQTKGPMTLDLGKVTATTVIFNASLDVNLMSDYQEVGFVYSTESRLDVESDAVTRIKVSREDYSEKITGLLYDTEYYYAIYLLKNGVYQYGETQKFRTDNIQIQLFDAVLSEYTVTFSGVVATDLDATNVEYGIEFSLLSDFSVSERRNVILDSEGRFDLKEMLSGEYYYRAYVRCNKGYKFYEKYSIVNLYWKDLSLNGMSNCYILNAAGNYGFRSTRGNSSESVGTISTVEVLWETFGTDVAPSMGDLVKNVSYNNSYIAFQTADTFKEGNAVIAAKDADGTILWSWHIWFTDQPQAQVYNNDAGTMMDRNLGATSATKGDVGALGLLYQWGRKDPFLGSSSISSSTLAKSTITWPSAVESNLSNGTIEYATAHPTTFITYNRSNYDWYYTGDSSTDNTRWTTSETAKSIYDPCPAGWRVPDGGSNGIWSKAGFDYTTYDSTNEGMSFSISSPSTTWYPASGYLGFYAGSLSNVGYYGYYWSPSPDGGACNLYFDYDGDVSPSIYSFRANGYSVRCLQESK